MADGTPLCISKKVSAFWFAAFAAALTLIAVGLALGEAGQVLMNARDVCLACLGVG